MFESLDPLARLVLQALLNTLWQGMLIAALVWLLLRVMRGASATTRHAVWLISLLTIGALPAIALLGTAREQPPRRETVAPVARPAAPAAIPEANRFSIEDVIAAGANQPVPAMAVVSTPVRERAGAAEAPRSVGFPLSPAFVAPPVPSMSFGAVQMVEPHEQPLAARFFAGRAPLALVCAWLLIVALMVARIARGYAFIFRMRRRLGIVPADQHARLQRLAAVFGIRRTVRLHASCHVSMPMTVGSLRPMILMPPDLAERLSGGEFDSVIAHELAHIKRWDYLTNLLQRIVQASLWFHPAVWFIGKQLMIERELACDDWAVKTCEPRRYANCLARLVELLHESKPRTDVRLTAAGILFGKHVITRRVEMILNRDRNATTSVSKPALLYAIGIALSFVVVCSLLQPVIAVPAGQKPAKQSKKESKPSAPAQPRAQQAVPAPPAGSAEFPELPDFPADLSEGPEPPVAAIAAADWDDDLVAPPAQPAIAVGITPIAPLAPLAAWTQDGLTIATPRPAPAPWPAPAVATTIGSLAEWGQDDKKKTPVIPETELLSLLVDIVKKDADPAVRQEALQGIYRMRSDAAVNALIGLYDSQSDAKVKGEIIAYLVRRDGDNSKAIAKLMTIAKSEQNEDLRNRAIRYLGAVKGEDGAGNLIQIYDGMQDQKAKLSVIRSLGANKSRKAVDKLIQIAKNDSDPAVRQYAIRALYGIDNRLYLDLLDGNRARIGMIAPDVNLIGPGLAGSLFVEAERKAWEEANERMREKMDGVWDQQRRNFKFDELEMEKLDEMLKKMEIELPKLQLKLKGIEDGKRIENDNLIYIRRQEIGAIESQLRQHQAVLTAQLAKQRASLGEASPKLSETQRKLEVVGRDLAAVRQLQRPQARPQARPSMRAAQQPALPRIRAFRPISSN